MCGNRITEIEWLTGVAGFVFQWISKMFVFEWAEQDFSLTLEKPFTVIFLKILKVYKAVYDCLVKNIYKITEQLL